jgi:hypothetical protein
LRALRRRSPALHALLLAAVVSSRVGAAGQTPTEYQVKAAFLFHFARLTIWPSEALAEDQPFVIAVVGRDPFGDVLDRTMAGQTAHGRPIHLRRYASLATLGEPPHIVFVNTPRAEVAEVLARFRTAPVLTVSDLAGFAEQGGVVGFRLTPDKTVRFDVNLAAAGTHGVRIRSQVLKLARILGGPQD